LANPSDFEPRNLINSAFFKTLSTSTTTISLLDGTITGSGTNDTYFDPTPSTGTFDALLIASDTFTFSGDSQLIVPTLSFGGFPLNSHSTSQISGHVTFAGSTPFVVGGVTLTGVDLVGPVGSAFGTQPGLPADGLASTQGPNSLLAFQFNPVPEPGTVPMTLGGCTLIGLALFVRARRRLTGA